MQKTIKSIVGILYTAYAIFIFILPIPLVLLFHLYAAILPEKKRLIRIYKAQGWWIRFWEALVGLKFIMEGKENLQPEESYVFVPNHVNMLDIAMVGSMLHHIWKPLTKKEIGNIPFLGWLICNISIVVDRSSPQSRKSCLRGMVSHLKRGISILIFPEGSRNRGNAPLGKFYPGAFRVAIEAQKPILPIIFYNTRKLKPVNEFRIYPGTGYIRLLKPIPTAGLSLDDLDEFIAQVHNIMQEKILELDEHYQAGNEEIQLA